MSISEHAENILSAWVVADQQRFECEVQKALSSCKGAKTRSVLESERHELLESIAEHFQTLPSDKRFSRSESQASFVLLHHLSQAQNGSGKYLNVSSGKYPKKTLIRH
jgi:hypothetical protein